MSLEPTAVLVHGALTDVAIPTRTLPWMSERAGSTIVEVDSSHAVPVSTPDLVAATIEKAAA